MNRQEFSDRQYRISIQAGMNQRYHHRWEVFWFRCDLAAKAATAVFAVIGAVLSVASIGDKPSAELVWSSVAFSLMASVSAVILNVLPFSSWERDHGELFRQWTDLREAVDDLEIVGESDPSADLAGELRKLTSKTHRICGQEKAPDLKILAECQAEEEKSRKPAAA